MSPTIAPTPGFRRRIHARRGHAIAVPSSPPQLDKLWARVTTTWKKTKKWWAPGFDANGDDLARRTVLASDLLSGKRPTTFDRGVFAAAERMVGFNGGDDLSLVWIANDLAGPVAALEIELDALGLETERGSAGSTWCMRLAPKPARFHGSLSFAATRSLVCSMNDDDYERARAVAAAARPAFDAKQRAAVAFFFPEEPWAEEGIRELLQTPATQPRAWEVVQLLASCKDTALADAFLSAASEWALSYLPDLALSLPLADVPDLLVTQVARAEASKAIGSAQWLTIAETLASIQDERVGRALARLLTHKFAGPVAVAYFREHSDVAQAVLPAIASGKTKAADAARAILESAARRAADTEEAPEADVPALLRDPPWRDPKKTKAKRAVLALEPLPLPERIVWAPGEREENAKTNHYRGDAREMTPEELAAYDATSPKHVDVWPRWANGQFHLLLVPTERGLAEWNQDPKSYANRGPTHVLARYGEAAIPGLLMRDPFGWTNLQTFDAMTHVESPRVALFAARGAQRKPYRKMAHAYLDRYPVACATGLVPVAFGEAGKDQRAAEDALRFLAQKGHEQSLRDVAERYGVAAATEMDAFLARDPLSVLEVKGKLPDFVRIDELPHPRTKKGQSVGAAAIEAILDALRGSPLDPAYPGLAQLKDELDPKSLADLAWALTTAWNLAGAKIIHAWMPQALAHFGDESTARKLAPLAAEWGRKDAKKAELGIAILAHLGTDAALLHLGNLADKARFAPARAAAKAALEAIAEARGLSLDELSDRTVPTLDLDADGSTTLDFGARTFRVVFDETLAPVVVAPDGTRAKTLPRGTKEDDKAKVKAASDRFKALKADALAVAANQIRRLERAMVFGRTWSAEDFDRLLAHHPLLVHLVRRLVWGTFDGGRLASSFRVAEDGTLADADDRELERPTGSVGIAHPLVLGQERREAWARVLGDYEIIQPFEQVGRGLHSLEPAELAGETSARFTGSTAKAGAVLGTLDARGWDRIADSWVTSYSRAVRTSHGEGRLTLTFEPGIALDDVAGSPVQTLKNVTLSGAPKLGDVDPIDLSEALRDLEALRR